MPWPVWALMAVATLRETRVASAPIEADADGRILLRPRYAQIEGELELYPQTLEDQSDSFTYKHGRLVQKERLERKARGWDTSDDALSWRFDSGKGGRYELKMMLACSPENKGRVVTIEVAGETLHWTVKSTPDWETLRRRTIGTVELPADELQTLRIFAKAPAGEVMRLGEIELLPLSEEETP